MLASVVVYIAVETGLCVGEFGSEFSGDAGSFGAGAKTGGGAAAKRAGT